MKNDRDIGQTVFWVMLSLIWSSSVACSAKATSPGVPPDPVRDQQPNTAAKTPLEGRWVLSCSRLGQGSAQGEVDFEGNEYLSLMTVYSDTQCGQMVTFTQDGGLFRLPAAGQIDLAQGDGSTAFNVYSIESGVLFLADSPGNAPGNRPASVDHGAPFTYAGAPLLDPSAPRPLPLPPAPNPAPAPAPAPAPVGACPDFSGHFQINSDLFFLVQTGCKELQWTIAGDPFEGTPDQTTDYLADGQERASATDSSVFVKSYFGNDRFVVEKRTVTGGQSSTQKSVYTLTAKPCDLYNPEPGATYLMRQIFSDGATQPSSCDFWVKEQNR